MRQGSGQKAEGRVGGQDSGSNVGGFTIVELLIATAVFSMVLLLCAIAIVNIGRAFYKGVTINRTQNTVRRVAEDVAQAIQLGGTGGAGFREVPATQDFGEGDAKITVHALCLGSVRYSYVPDRSLGGNSSYQAKHVLWKDRLDGGSCTPQDLTRDTPSFGEEMLGNNMRLPVFDVPEPPAGESVWKIKVTVSYGDTADLFVTGSNFTQCIGRRLGGQFCAIATINTNAVKRL